MRTSVGMGAWMSKQVTGQGRLPSGPGSISRSMLMPARPESLSPVRRLTTRAGSGSRGRRAPVAKEAGGLLGADQVNRQFVVTIGEKSDVMREESISADEEVERAAVSGTFRIQRHVPRLEVGQ